LLIPLSSLHYVFILFKDAGHDGTRACYAYVGNC
jgi:hypothetical protein